MTPRPADRPALVRTRDELSAARAALAGPVAVVMTMGALHAGHAALVDAARARVGAAGSVLVTIFVNPLQFGEGADLAAYPRTLDADLDLLAAHRAGSVDLVFAPAEAAVYPRGRPTVRVAAGPLGSVLEGVDRPGHFDGVLTVVLKLAHLTRPDVMVFGAKDAQQLVLVRAMVADLDLGAEVLAVPTVREADGLAISSRNARLAPHERAAALALSRALAAGAARTADGPAAVLGAAQEVLDGQGGALVDHLALVDPASLAPVPDGAPGPALLVVAARVGATRLIDNVAVVLGGRDGRPPGPGPQGRR